MQGRSLTIGRQDLILNAALNLDSSILTLGSLLVDVPDKHISFNHLKHVVLNQKDAILRLDNHNADSFISTLQDVSATKFGSS